MTAVGIKIYSIYVFSAHRLTRLTSRANAADAASTLFYYIDRSLSCSLTFVVYILETLRLFVIFSVLKKKIFTYFGKVYYK